MCPSSVDSITESGSLPKPVEDPEDSASANPDFKKRRRGPILTAVVFALLILFAAAFLANPSLTNQKRAAPSTPNGSSTSTAHADLSRVLRLKGTTEAVETRAMLAPVLAGEQVRTLTITNLARGGTRVKRGDLLAEFDRQAQMRDFIDKQADHAKLADQVLEEQAKENAARAKDETEIKQAEDSLSKAQLEMQKIEILSRIDAEKAQEDLDEATATLQQLRETFDLKRKAALAAIRILEIQRDRTQETMEHARANSDLMQIHSPIDGVVVLNTIWKQGKMGEVQEGDQIRAGVPFMQVVNPSQMEVRASVNQEDFLSLQIGQIASVHLDAYPQLVFPAKLEEMAPIGKGGDFSSTLRVFGVVFSISGNDSKLMPDLSAAVDVDLGATRTTSGGLLGGDRLGGDQ
jgi:multidrug efflux pump subunit AcrA (membrane-fusion protein)